MLFARYFNSPTSYSNFNQYNFSVLFKTPVLSTSTEHESFYIKCSLKNTTGTLMCVVDGMAGAIIKSVGECHFDEELRVLCNL